jgi:hypothetical protein
MLTGVALASPVNWATAGTTREYAKSAEVANA